MRRVLSIVLVAVLALVVGCSDDDESSAPTTTVASEGRRRSNDAYCNFLLTFSERYGQVNPSLADPPQFRSAMEEAAAAAKEAAASAPEAIKADLAVLNTGLDRLMGILRRVNFDVTKLQMAELQEIQGTPEFVEAGRRVEEYRQQNCP